MQVLVTGALGFVAINVVRELAAAGHDVIGVDVQRQDDLATAFLAEVSDRVTIATGDLGTETWSERLGDVAPDAVVHAAAVTPLGRHEARQALLAIEINVTGTARVLRWAAAAGVTRVIHVSTGSVYGPVDGTNPVDEDADHRPEGLYGITKSAADRLARRLAALEGLDLAVLRLSHVYGPMERASVAREIVSPVERWTRALILRGPIDPPQREVTRDFVHVRDVARAVRALVDGMAPGIAAYNVSSGVLTSEDQLAALLRSIDPELQTGEAGEDRPPSSRRPPLGIDRIRNAIGWRPEISLDDGLRSYVAWRRGNECPRWAEPRP